MRSIVHLLLFSCALQVCQSCTPPYDTWFDGYCYNVYASSRYYKLAVDVCTADNAVLTSIHSAKENSQMIKFLTSAPSGSMARGFWIGLLCDGSKFSWYDGTPVDYTNFNGTTKCNAETKDKTFIVGDNGYWREAVELERQYICKKLYRSEVSLCDEYEYVPGTKTCVSLEKTSTTADKAEKACVRTEGHLAAIHDSTVNDFIRRGAVSQFMVNGVIIGLKQDKNNSTSWNDKSPVDYTNFAPGFPNVSLGQCFAMQTSSLEGEWVNINCDPVTIPYACTKAAFDFPETVQSIECPSKYYNDGDDIYSPKFPMPNGVSNCEYVIIGPETAKSVEVEVVFFETNRCCDTLTILDGVSGEKEIAKLAGNTYNGKKYKSVYGPALRLEYNAQSGAHVRGWHLRVKAIY